MAGIIGERANIGDAIVDYEDKVFEDIQAEPGEKAYILMHTVPFEGSVGLINMLTATSSTERIRHPPGVVRPRLADGLRHSRVPKVGDEAFPGTSVTTSS